MLKLIGIVNYSIGISLSNMQVLNSRHGRFAKIYSDNKFATLSLSFERDTFTEEIEKEKEQRECFLCLVLMELSGHSERDRERRERGRGMESG